MSPITGKNFARYRWNKWNQFCGWISFQQVAKPIYLAEMVNHGCTERNALITCYNWLLTYGISVSGQCIQRDIYASYVGHCPILVYFANGENESIGRDRYNFMQVLMCEIFCICLLLLEVMVNFKCKNKVNSFNYWRYSRSNASDSARSSRKLKNKLNRHSGIQGMGSSLIMLSIDFWRLSFILWNAWYLLKFSHQWVKL